MKRKLEEGSGSGCSCYLHVRLEIGEGDGEVDRSLKYLDNVVSLALKTLFGEVGAAIPFMVKKFFESEAVIECPDTGLTRLRAALTLQSTYQGRPCCFTTTAVTQSYVQ